MATKKPKRQARTVQPKVVQIVFPERNWLYVLLDDGRVLFRHQDADRSTGNITFSWGTVELPDLTVPRPPKGYRKHGR